MCWKNFCIILEQNVSRNIVETESALLEEKVSYKLNCFFIYKIVFD
jgi:hypothetical protein